jgi:hypothetical protein
MIGAALHIRAQYLGPRRTSSHWLVLKENRYVCPMTLPFNSLRLETGKRPDTGSGLPISTMVNVPLRRLGFTSLIDSTPDHCRQATPTALASNWQARKPYRLEGARRARFSAAEVALPRKVNNPNTFRKRFDHAAELLRPERRRSCRAWVARDPRLRDCQVERLSSSRATGSRPSSNAGKPIRDS